MTLTQEKKRAQLVLQDGSVFDGYSFGANISTSGEVVFNTGMVGYPETLSDPSYEGQILVATYPLIGNYGVPPKKHNSDILENFESEKIRVRGLIVSDYSSEHNHWNSALSLSEWMQAENIPGIFGVDTRALTKKLRSTGTKLGKIIQEGNYIELYDPNKENLLLRASIQKPILYKSGPVKICLIDCGCKNNIIRNFTNRGVTVIRVPWDYNFFNETYDGLFISNGPGDPKMARETIYRLSIALTQNKPIFGICLGNQLLALAAGADTYKLQFGHRSQNQPCIEAGTKRCFITSQNHGFAVSTKSLPPDWEPWFTNANDNTNEGIRHKSKPFFSVQFHPEANPGPVDTSFLFDRFIAKLG